MTILLGVVGLCGGAAVAAGVFALIGAIGLVQRMAQKTGTKGLICHYETCFILGGTLGNLFWIYDFPLWGGTPVVLVVGLAYGIYMGCFVMSLAETLNVFPVLIRRSRISLGFPWIITAFALGKALGSLFYLGGFRLPFF